MAARAWRSAPGHSPQEITPAFSELAHPTAFRPQPQSGLSRLGVQMSLVALGQHYVRDGTGSEQLYDVIHDPFETVNLMGSARGDLVVGTFRRMLLKVLTADPCAIEVENAYLKPYRQWLKAVAEESPAPRQPMSALE